MMDFHFHPEALAEYHDAAVWYDTYANKRGSEFLEEVSESIDLITEEPFLWPIYEGACRRALTGRYPYAVIFLVENEEILIVAIAHLSRKPGYWLPRVSV